jgi:hypothetical protein
VILEKNVAAAALERKKVAADRGVSQVFPDSPKSYGKGVEIEKKIADDKKSCGGINVHFDRHTNRYHSRYPKSLGHSTRS